MAATLVVEILTSTAKAVAGLKSVSSATDNAATSAEKHSKSLGSVAKAAGLAVGAAALGGLVMMMKTGAQEESDFLAGQAQLANGIKSTGNAANVTVKGLENLASSIQSYSGQTDDSIVASEKLLLTFTNIRNEAGKNNDIFNQAVKVTADMAAKMGGDASKYAVQLGKALNDPVKGLTSLTRVGVSFSAGQTKMIKRLAESGQTMKAQKIILGELNKEFGGSARAAGQTLPGQLARAKRGFEDVSQQLIAAMLPALTKLADILIKDVMPAFSKVMGFISSHMGLTVIMATGIMTLVAAYKVWKFWTITLTAANRAMLVSFATNPFVLIIAGLAALVIGLIYAYNHFKWFRNFVQGALRALKSAWSAVWSALKSGLRAMADLAKMVAQVWKVQFRILATVVRGAWNVIRAIWNTLVRFLMHTPLGAILIGPWRIAINAFKALVRGGISGVIAYFKGLISGLGRILAPIARIISAPFKAAWDTIKGIWNGAIAFFRSIADGIKGIFDSVFGGIKGVWNAIANTINSVHLSVKVPSFVPGIGGKGWEWSPHIPTLARGGYFTRPTLALVGEAGNEIVAPEVLLRRMLRESGQGTTINVYGALDPDSVARQIDRLLRGRARRVGGVRQ